MDNGEGQDEQDAPKPEGDEEPARRVRPLLRPKKAGPFDDAYEGEREEAGEGDSLGEAPGEEDEDAPKVRPVRIVKLTPKFREPEEEAPFAEVEEAEGEAPFAEVGEAEGGAPFAEVGEAEGEAPFAEVGDVEEETPFAEVERTGGEAPFAEVEGTGGEAPFAEVDEVQEEVPPFTEVQPVEEAAPITSVEEVIEVEGEEDAPEVPFAVIEEMEREAVPTDSLDTEEEQEMSEELQLRQEETPVSFQGVAKKREEDVPRTEAEGIEAERAGPSEARTIPAVSLRVEEAKPDEEKPAYHKYLKPDEDLVQRQPVRGKPSGFDRDLESEAGEIDFGIDLIDPSQRKKKRRPGPKKEQRPQKGKAGGHDFDAEVGSKDVGQEIGVDMNKRRKKRRL